MLFLHYTNLLSSTYSHINGLSAIGVTKDNKNLIKPWKEVIDEESNLLEPLR